MLEPPARWETNRLVMKSPTRAEAAVMFETYAADPEVSRYTIWRPHRSVEETEQFLRRCEDGYVLAPRLWRRGLMSEAVAGLIEWAMASPEIFRVWAVCDADNVASARLLESVGMRREGTLRRWLVHPNLGDAPRDCLCYAIVKPAD